MSNLMSMFKLSRKSQSNLAEWSKDDDKLVQAVEQGRFKDIQRLVQKKKVSPNKLDPQGHSAFHLAAMRNCFQALQLFLAYGATADSVDAHGRTPLHCAARHGAAEALELLLHCKDDSWQLDGDGMTALHHACISGNTDCIISLLRKFPKSINTVDQDGRTPLCHAAHIGHANVCKELLDRGASPDASDKHGRTCLMYAAESGNTAVCELFLAHGAQVDLEDQEGHSALWYAVDGGHSGVKFILERAAGISHEVNLSQGAAGQPKRDVTPIAEENEEDESTESSHSEDEASGGSTRGGLTSNPNHDEADQPSSQDHRIGDHAGGHTPPCLKSDVLTNKDCVGVGVTDVVDGVSLSDTANDDDNVESDDDSIQVSSLSSDCDSLLEDAIFSHPPCDTSDRHGSPSVLSHVSNKGGEASSSGFSSISRHGAISPASSLPTHRSASDSGIEQKVEMLQSALLVEKKKNAKLNEQIQSLTDQLQPTSLQASGLERDACDSNCCSSSGGRDECPDDTERELQDEDETLTDQLLMTEQQQGVQDLQGRPVAKVEGQQRNVSMRKETKEIASLKEIVAQLREENSQLKANLEAQEKLNDCAPGGSSSADEVHTGQSVAWQQLHHVESELRLATLARDQLQTELSELKQRVVALAANDSRLATEVTALLKKNAALDNDLASAREALTTSEQTRERCLQKLAQYKVEYRKLKALARSQDALRKKLENDNRELAREARREQRRRHHDSEKAMAVRSRLQAACERLSAENDALLDQCEEFATAAGRLRDKLDEKNDELARMSDLLDSNGAILELKTSETRSLEQQLAAATSLLVEQGDVSGGGGPGNAASGSPAGSSNGGYVNRNPGRQLAAAAAAVKETQALREQLSRLQRQLSDTDESYRTIIEAYRCHLIAAVEGQLSKEVEQALQTIIEMRKLAQ